MAFLCSKCSAVALEITDAIIFQPDNRSDEIMLQVIACRRCGFRGLAVYEESRRGALASDSWEHTGYRVGGDELSVILQAIRSCPNPRNPNCGCATHLILGRKSYGRWVQLRGFDILDSFPMRRDK
jgi:DNA-directed RNA polymerase subunit RPC12/RpoP